MKKNLYPEKRIVAFLCLAAMLMAVVPGSALADFRDWGTGAYGVSGGDDYSYSQSLSSVRGEAFSYTAPSRDWGTGAYGGSGGDDYSYSQSFPSERGEAFSYTAPSYENYSQQSNRSLPISNTPDQSAAILGDSSEWQKWATQDWQTVSASDDASQPALGFTRAASDPVTYDGNAATAGNMSGASSQSAARITYDYNAELFKPDSGNYPGVYSTKISPNNATAENAPTIGIPSIADQNLNVPTTESPAIIRGAAVGYEERTGPVEFKTLKERVRPYSDYRYSFLEEKAADGTTHKKTTGFDQTYVLVRLEVSEFFTSGKDDLVLHVKVENNRALIPGMGMKQNSNGQDYQFTDGLGSMTGSYKKEDLIDEDGKVYLDIILFATGKLAAGADIGKANAVNGDVPVQMYVDADVDYNPDLKYDATSTDPNHQKNVLAKFFDETKANSATISRFLLKGSDLALEVAVENSGGENKDTGTTYWSLEKAIEDPYYDQEIDRSPTDQGSGRTLKLISEVPVTSELTLKGADANNLKKRTLDVNSFDIQVANNSTQDTSTYTSGFTLENAWLTIADKSNTTGAEMAIGNNAKFVIDKGGKLIIDETCQLEIEWDGATTTPAADGQTQPAQPDILNNGILDLRAGGEIVNNGIITIEGTEGKPVQPGTEQQQPVDSKKGFGELTIEKGATLTNNGSLIVYGKLYNLGTIVNNGKYDDTIISNDPDKGKFAYHKGIQISWKDDVTQSNVEPGALINGKDGNGTVNGRAILLNNGDIVLVPGSIENYGSIINNAGARILLAAATEAIIPINADPATPTITTKRITLNPATPSKIDNYGTLVNFGSILPASVALNDNGSFGTVSTPGAHPELFTINNTNGKITNFGTMYGWPSDRSVISGDSDSPYSPENKLLGSSLLAVLTGSVNAVDDTWLYLYKDGTFLMLLPNGEKITGTYQLADGMLTFTLDDGTDIIPTVDEDGNYVYSIPTPSGDVFEFTLTADYITSLFEE